MNNFLHNKFKKLFFAAIVMTLCFNASYVYAFNMVQIINQKTVTINFKEKPIRVILNEIKKQTGIGFAISDTKVEELLGSLTIQVRNVSVKQTLDQLLKGTGFIYEIASNHIIIKSEVRGKVSSTVPVEVKGRVLDSKSEPIAGATIVILGTSKGDISTQNGGFTISSKVGDVLEISFIGFVTIKHTVRISDAKELIVKLEEDVLNAGDVVVTGIFNRTKELATGASYTVTGKELRQVGNSNVLNSLRTFDPSFKIIENNINGSDPNKLPDIELRGANGIPDLDATYKGNPNQPLFILDGFETSLQRVIDLDINRIESITLLKDAAAAALYGSRSANGVVVIETKAPEVGRLRLGYSGDFAVVMPDLTDYNLLNANEALELQYNAGHFNGSNFNNDRQYKEYYNRQLRNVKEGVNTYWLSQPLRTAFENRHNVNLSGGDEVVRYGINFTARFAPGVMKGSSRDNYQGGTFLQYRKKGFLLKNDLQIGYNIAQNSPYGSFSKYVALNPYSRPFDENGNTVRLFDADVPSFFPKTYNSNPLYDAMLNLVDSESYFEVTDNFSAEIKLNDNFTIMGRFGINYKTQKNDKYKPADHSDFADMGNQNDNIDDYLRRGSVNYGGTRDIGLNGDLNVRYGQTVKNHSIYAVVGANIRQVISQGESFMAEGFPNPEMSDIGFAKQYAKDSRPSSDYSISRLAGILGSFNYSYNKKYLFDASIKIDGSSNFGANNRYAPVWSVGAGWNIHYEEFMKGLKALSRLKIRGSYGVTGSQNFSSFQSMMMYEYKMDSHYMGLSPARIKAMGNSDLKWQQTDVWNIGLELGFFEDRLLIIADYYKRKTNNLLADVTIAPSTGFSKYKDNVGATLNKGIDVTARAYIIKNNAKSMFWNINVSLACNDNKVVKISNAMKKRNDDTIAKAMADGTQTPILLYVEGNSLNSIYAVPSLGIDPATGKEVFLGSNGRPTYLWNALDQVAVGNSRPDAEGIVGTTFSYKNLSFSASFRYKIGGQIYNSTLVERVENANLYGNVDRRVYDERWSYVGQNSFFKDVKDNTKTRQTSRFVQDENVFSGESISIAYDIRSKKLLKTLGMERMRITGYMNEIFRFSTVKQERGTNYPFANRFAFSLNVTF